jgi:enoyl reductase-like protein
VFKLPREKRGAWLWEHRAEVIQRLNVDYFEPWFPAKKDGRVVQDLGDMTYEEIVLHLVRLMFVTHEDRWLDLSLRNLTRDWLRHVKEHFAGVNGSGPKASHLQSYSSLDKPSTFLTNVRTASLPSQAVDTSLSPAKPIADSVKRSSHAHMLHSTPYFVRSHPYRIKR